MMDVIDEFGDLPDVYEGVGGLVPSAFKLNSDKKEKLDNPLLPYKNALDEEEAPDAVKAELQLISDFDLARRNLKKVMTTSDTILTDAIALAQASDSPRAYEVVATLMKALSDINKDLLDLHETREVIRSKRVVKGGDLPGVQNQQNNFFVGSPAELNRLMNEAKITENN